MSLRNSGTDIKRRESLSVDAKRWLTSIKKRLSAGVEKGLRTAGGVETLWAVAITSISQSSEATVLLVSEEGEK